MNKDLPNIVHIAPYYPPHIGGMERVAKISAEGLSRKGYNVQVITSTKSGIKKGIEKKGNITIDTLWSFEFAHTPFATALLWHLWKIPRNSIIHLHLSQAYYPELVMFTAKLRRIPYVVHFHLDVGASGILGPIFLLYKKLFWGSLMRNASLVIACAPDQLEIIPKKFNVLKEKIKIVPNAVSEEFFSNRVYVPSTERLRLLYIGRLVAQKRLERIINAVSKLTVPAHLTIVGDGEELSKLKTLVAELGLSNISFEGKKNDKEMQKYHRENDLFLISSDREGTSLVVLEAMASGLPVAGSNVSGINDLLSDAGVLVEEPYAEGFAEAIEELWHNPKKLVLLSHNSREKAKMYDWSRFISEIEEVYKEVGTHLKNKT